MSVEILRTQGWLRLASGIGQERLHALPLDEALDEGVAGRRDLLTHPWCAALVAPIRARLHTLGLLAEGAPAVQCTLFRKTADCNWNVPYHQDLSLSVAERVSHPALSGWSLKDDGPYVQPPIGLLERILAVRLHLDACAAEAGALRVLPGSHRFGRLRPDSIARMDKRSGEAVCAADVGDLLLMRPLLLHASSKAARPNGRRVLHFVFAPPQPGYGLKWRIAV